MIDFLRKFVNHGIKIARVNLILITKFIKVQFFTLILHGVRVRCDRRRFSVHSPFIEKSIKVVFYGQEPNSGESTTTECGVNYRLLAVMY